MNNTQEQLTQGIIISVDNLNRRVWGSIYQFIKHLYAKLELKDFGLDIYWADSTTKIQFDYKNKIELGSNSVKLGQETKAVILYNKSDGHDDFDHIASFLMLEKKYSGKLVLGINLNNIGSREANDYKFRLAVFCRLSNNKPIRLLLKETIVDKKTGEVKQIDEQKVTQTKDVARTYLPLCRITESTYNQLFVKQIDDVKKAIDGNEDEQKLIQYVQESIKKLEEDFNEFYLKEFNKRYTTLFDKWFILSYFYSLGDDYIDKRIKSEKTSKTNITDEDIVTALKTYTNNIQELSQNIIRYVTDKEGYLYVAFIKNEDISKDILEKNNTLANIDAEVKRFVEFGIMDGANKGIVTTFKERPENIAEEIELINFFDLNPTKTINLTSLDMRYAAHLGLKTFVASIKGQSGYFYVESNDDNAKSRVELCNGDIKGISSPDFIDGTHFHVIVPVSKIKGLITSQKSHTHSSTTSFIEQYKEILNKGNRIRVSDTDLSSILRLSSSTDIDERNNEIKELGDKIAKEKYSIDEIKREIALEIPENDGSPYIVQNIYRLINYLQLSLNNNYFTTIVLTNLSDGFVDAFWNLFDIHVIKAKLDPVWRNDCAIVLMSKNLNYRIISGETIIDIVALNNEVRKHYCISTNYPSYGTATIKEELKYFVRPYELLIDNNIFFYNYVDNLLRKCIEDQEQGYCVRHRHTYIGSKMIVVNYYEAETLFQNSFFAERFAFLIAQKLRSEQINFNEDLCIIGAGYYSDLMIKSLQRIIDKPKTTTMLAIDDGDKISFHYSIKPNQKSNFVIITPIGSTLSYCDKIVAFLMQKFGINKDKTVHHCVIVVGNKNQYKNNQNYIHAFSKGGDGLESDIEYTFRWESIDIQKKQINLRYKNVEKVDYDILIGQKNKEKDEDNWHHRIDNLITFPKDDYGSEKYVNLTENQSINSQNLLGLPKLHDSYLDSSKHETELEYLKELMPYIYHGHIKNHHTHYRYYVHSEEFIAKEKVKADSKFALWVADLKKKYPLSQNSDGCLNIIVTPNAKIESEFVNYINKEVFCNNAQIISIDAHSWKNNMVHKYKYIGDVVKNNESVRFHYVDHALLTANTYLKTKSFLEEITERKFSSVIVLINRVSPNLTDDIAINDNFCAFLNLLIPESTDNISDCLLCALEEFYKHFRERTISSDCNEIIERNECKIKKTTFEEVKKKGRPINDKKQLRLLFTHELFYRIANINNSPDDSACEKYDLTKAMLDVFYSSGMNAFCKKWVDKECNEIDQRISFVKVISSPPLSRFIAVREYAYLKLLEILKTLLEEKVETGNLDDLKLLKAVLKSLSFLNSTALVRKKVILDSWRMYNSVFMREFNDLELNRTKGSVYVSFEEVVNKRIEEIDYHIETKQADLFSQEEQDEFRKKKDRIKTLNETYITFPKELYFYIKNAILEDETKSMFLNELLRTGVECLTMEMLKENAKTKEDFQVMHDKGSMFCEEVKQQYEFFLEWLFYDTTTVLQKALDNFEKETIKDDGIKKSFYKNSEDNNPKKWILADYQKAVADITIQNFRDKVEGDGNKVEYYYENLKLYNSNAERIDYIDKLVRVLYAKLKLEKLVDSETDNLQTKIEDDIINLLTILSDIIDSYRAFIIFKHNEQAYYEFAVGYHNRCGKVDAWEQFIKDFFISKPFEPAQKKIQSEEYYCEYTRIDDHSVLYFAYDGETNKPSNAQKQLLLLLRNKLCQYIKSISNKGLLDVWVEKKRTDEFFKERYRKNTHNLYKNLNKVSGTFFDDSYIDRIDMYHVYLYAILAELYVGKIHNSILVDEKQKYICEQKDYSEIKANINQFVRYAKAYLVDKKILDEETATERFVVNNLSEYTYYYNNDIHFLLFQFIQNITKYTLPGWKDEVVVSIYVDKDCLVIKNTHSQITLNKIGELKTRLKLDFHNEELKDSISLYCINFYCKEITGKELDIDIEGDNTFVVRIPIIVNK